MTELADVVADFKCQGCCCRFQRYWSPSPFGHETDRDEVHGVDIRSCVRHHRVRTKHHRLVKDFEILSYLDQEWDFNGDERDFHYVLSLGSVSYLKRGMICCVRDIMVYYSISLGVSFNCRHAKKSIFLLQPAKIWPVFSPSVRKVVKDQDLKEDQKGLSGS